MSVAAYHVLMGSYGSRTTQFTPISGSAVAPLPERFVQLRCNHLQFDFGVQDALLAPPLAHCEIAWHPAEAYLYHYAMFAPCIAERDKVMISMQTAPGERAELWVKEYRRALNRLQTTRRPITAVIYALLWSISTPAEAVARSVYVERAEEVLQRGLAEGVRVADVASAVGLSPAQLGRYFVRDVGMSPARYLGHLRAERAFQLLKTTTMQIKAVAAECGMHDAQAFDHFVRKWLGVSPRAIRTGAAVVDVFPVPFRAPAPLRSKEPKR